MTNFKAIILQPISNTKSTWRGYDKNHDDFLTYFQKTFKKEIEQKFNVNHSTEDFSDYLLIPYLVSNQKCFGAYYINSGSKSTNDDYSWSYNIDYSKSYNFLKDILKCDLINEIEFNNDTIESIEITDRVSYFQSSILSNKSKEYILALCENKAINI